MIVRDWPTYLLKNIPRDIRAGIEEEAGAGSMAEVVRGILCEHYGLDCRKVVARNRFIAVNGTETMLLRLQPELWEEIKKEAKRRGTKKRPFPIRSVIIEALEAHYE